MKTAVALTIATLLAACGGQAKDSAEAQSPAPPAASATAAEQRQPANDEAQASQHRAACAQVSELAASIMKGRQSGVAMAKMMEVPEDNEFGEIARALVIDAFDSPRMSVETNRETMVRDFENKAYLQCIKAG